ncbi:MAG: hypothetical protein LKF52_02145 [Butyrivibrio sp.]|jgi:hypothetical protein|nr:hypothetical protein [Butyrivibrio sp.]
MHFNYCTLFDSNYLDKGVVLIQSLNQCARDFTLYIFAFDEACEQFLNQAAFHNVAVLSEKKLAAEYSTLESLKAERTRAEYCWTCTPYCITYVLDKKECDNCTYIDTDMYFWSDPGILIEEMIEHNKSAMVTPHFFEKNLRSEMIRRMCGNYCVEFNTFLSTPEGRSALDWWREKCTQECSVNGSDDTYGDQKYLDRLVQKYDSVYEAGNPGGGMAPWNVMKYQHTRIEGKHLWFKEKGKERQYELIYYHFQGCTINDTMADLGYHQWCGKNEDHVLTKFVYRTYIQEIRSARKKYSLFAYKNAETSNSEVASSKRVRIVQKSIKRSVYQHGYTILSLPRVILFRKYDFIKLV